MTRHGLLAVGVVLVSAAAWAVGIVDPVGRWMTSNGPMVIEKAADGSFTLTFEDQPGTVTGRLYSLGDDGGDMRMSGVWRDVIKDSECPEALEGSRHWGGFDLTFHGPPNLDREVVGGLWTFCERIKPMPTGGGTVSQEGWSFSGERQ